MPVDPAESALTDPARTRPASPEAPDTPEPPRAGALEGEARISLEPVPRPVTASVQRER